MSRIALISDIHGNSLALDAVLQDAVHQGGVDEYWCLGDYVALGPDPIGVLSRLEALPTVRFIRGNTDRYVACGDRPEPTLDQVSDDVTLLPRLIEVAHTFAWTQGMVTAADRLNWLWTLSLDFRGALGGVRVLAVHAAPGQDDGRGIPPELAVDELRQLLEGCEADLVLVGHTHRAMNRLVGEVRVINPGAVSLSNDGAAHYAILECTGKDVRCLARSVPYDRNAVIAQLERVRHPGRAFLIRHLR
jgi:putative phosphoesterase